MDHPFVSQKCTYSPVNYSFSHIDLKVEKNSTSPSAVTLGMDDVIHFQSQRLFVQSKRYAEGSRYSIKQTLGRSV